MTICGLEAIGLDLMTLMFQTHFLIPTATTTFIKVGDQTSRLHLIHTTVSKSDQVANGQLDDVTKQATFSAKWKVWVILRVLQSEKWNFERGQKRLKMSFLGLKMIIFGYFSRSLASFEISFSSLQHPSHTPVQHWYFVFRIDSNMYCWCTMPSKFNWMCWLWHMHQS